MSDEYVAIYYGTACYAQEPWKKLQPLNNPEKLTGLSGEIVVVLEGANNTRFLAIASTVDIFWWNGDGALSTLINTAHSSVLEAWNATLHAYIKEHNLPLNDEPFGWRISVNCP